MAITKHFERNVRYYSNKQAGCLYNRNIYSTHEDFCKRLELYKNTCLNQIKLCILPCHSGGKGIYGKGAAGGKMIDVMIDVRILIANCPVMKKKSATIKVADLA